MIRSAAFAKLIGAVPRDKIAHDIFGFGNAMIDARINGGLTRNALHEVFASTIDDSGSAAAFALMMAMRACPDNAPLVWICEHRGAWLNGHVYAPGLAEIGIDPDRILMIAADDALAVARAAADIVKCSAVGAVIVAPAGAAPCFTMTTSRRFALSAAKSGVLTLIVRAGVAPMPSAAQSRWSIASAPARPLPGDAPGHPTFDMALLRHRGGAEPFAMRVTWQRDEARFAPCPGTAMPVPYHPSVLAQDHSLAA